MDKSKTLLLSGILAASLVGCGGPSISVDSLKDKHIQNVYGSRAENALKFRDNDIKSGNDCKKFYGELVEDSNRRAFYKSGKIADAFTNFYEDGNNGLEYVQFSSKVISDGKGDINVGRKESANIEKVLDKLAGTLLFKKDYLSCISENPFRARNMMSRAKVAGIVNNLRIPDNTKRIETLIKAHMSIARIADIRFDDSETFKHHMDKARFYTSDEFISSLPEKTVNDSRLKKYEIFLSQNE